MIAVIKVKSRRFYSVAFISCIFRSCVILFVTIAVLQRADYWLNSTKTYLNNRVFLSMNYRLIVAPRKFDVLKDGAYYCYCAYVLRISRYSDFLSLMLTNKRDT